MKKIITKLFPYKVLRLKLSPAAYCRCLLPLFFLLLISQQLRAQSATSSPYSRYGIGDLQFGGFSKNIGMGGLSFGVNNPFNINFSNPASYTSLLFTTFEAGFNANFLELKNATGKGSASDVSFGYFAMGFPVMQKKWGMSFGLLPYSNVGYNISKDDTNEVGDLRRLRFSGTGGLNQFYIGNAFTLAKGLSFGANASFLFGTINQERRLYYPNGNYLNTHVTDANIINDYYLSFGLQQTFDSLKFAKSDSLVMFERDEARINDSIAVINKAIIDLNKDSISTDTKLVIEKDGEKISVKRDNFNLALASLNEQHRRLDSLSNLVVKRKQRSNWSLTLGLTGAPSMKLKGTHSILAENYLLDGLGNEYARDTALNINDRSKRLVLPLSLGFGFAFKQGTRWVAGADFSVQNWQDYSLFGQTDSLANSWRVAVGTQWTPNDRSLKSYFGLVSYRLGFHYEQTYLNINSSELNQMGVSFGMGFPFKRSATMFHVSVEAGRRGTIKNSLIEENYIKLSLGFTLNDRWFIKPKFD